MTKYPSERWDH